MQLSIFDSKNDFKFTKPIRLISLFSGYDSQLLALKYLGTNVESWKTCEWAVKSIQALKDLHFGDDNTDYSKDLTKEQLIEFLYKKGISSNYNEPMTEQQIKRLGETKLRNIYNNIKATHNMVNIQQVHGKDLEIKDVDKFEYLVTYSYPCQDLSLAGKQEGMKKGSGTRSGMLWEFERILDECSRGGYLPTVCVMENVPQVHGKKNLEDFNIWMRKLESLGYKNYWKDLNAKCYGIPQNRNRCFMVSILGDYNFTFPEPIELKLRLTDLLEDVVDEKYYLSDSMRKYIQSTNDKWTGNNGNNSTINREIACTKTTREGNTRCDVSDYICKDLPKNFVFNKYKEFIQEKGYFPDKFNPYHKVEIKEIAPTQTTQCGSTTSNSAVLIKEENLKSQLCNKLIENNMVEEGDVIRHSYTKNRLENGEKNMGRIENHEKISPTLDTRCDCLGVCVKQESIYTDTEKKLFTEDGNIKRYIESDTIDQFNEGQMATTSFPNGYGHGPRTHNESITLNTLDKPSVKKNLRIRKLLPLECFRLQGVKDNDFEKIAKNQSDASLFHLSGDSICLVCLIAIFGQLLGLDYKNYIDFENWWNVNKLEGN